MAALILHRRFEQQPQEAVELNRENYFAARLIAGTHGGAQFTNVANGRILTRTAGVSQGPGHLAFAGTAGNRIEYGTVGIASSFTIVARIRPRIDTVNHTIFDSKAFVDWTTNKGFTFLLRESSAGRGFQFHVGTGLTYSNSGVYFAPGASYYVEAVFKPGTNQDVFIDGVEAAYTSRTVASSFVASSNTLKTGTYYDQTASRSANSEIEFAYLFDGAFSAAERNALRENPWQLFRRPLLRILSVSSGGPNSYTINPSGGLSTGGTVGQLHTKVFDVSGGVSFDGSAPIENTSSYVISPSGGFVFDGSVNQAHTRVFSVDGGVDFSGTSDVVYSKTISPAGGVVFGGSSSITNQAQYVLDVSGGMTFDGSTEIIKSKTITPTGGLNFNGSSSLITPDSETSQGQHVFQRQYIGRR